MESIKKHWKEILIVLLLIFSMSKCTSSCSNATKFEESEKAKTEIVQKADSVQKVLSDSIVVLNTRIQVYEEKVAGLNQSLSIQDEANKRISEAKKNIAVSVRQAK